MKNLKKLIVLAVLALFSINCNKEDTALVNTESKTPNFSAKAFTSEEVLDIVSSFNKRIESRKYLTNSKGNGQSFWVDQESAIGVRDSIGNMTYSFLMYVENGQENSVYNLVVNRRVDGNDSPDFVMRYEFIDQDILKYSQTDEKRFNGKIDAFSFESFLSSLGESSKGGTPKPCYDDIGPDPNTNNNNTTSSGNGASSGNNGGSGYNSGATTTSGSTGWATAGSVGYTGAQSGGGKKKGSVEVGQGCFCAPKTKTQKSSTNNGDDCPKGEMLIAVNTHVGIFHTACRSFEYEDFGLTGTKVAAVKGIEHPVLRTDRCPGVGYVFPQSTYYFTLPSWKPRAKRESAMALERAFKKLNKYFQDDIPCSPNSQSYIGLLSSKLLEFTKQEFTKIGGAASIYPPSGWNGEEHAYETNVGLFVPDC